MIKLDSIKLAIGTDAINSIDHKSTNFVLTQKRDVINNEVISETLQTIEQPCIGFKSVRYDNYRKEAILEVSGKILKEQYFDLININTIERVFEEVNKCSPVKFHVPTAIDTARMLTMDCTNNLLVDGEPAKYTDALIQLRANEKYNVNDYKQSGNKGVVFAGKQRTFKERQIFYVKVLDLLRDKQMKREPYFEDVIRQHKNILRVESNHTSLERIRRCTGGVNNMLTTVLTSTENPNLWLFNKITNINPNNQLMLELERGKYAGMPLHYIEKRIGMEGIIREFNFDMVLIIDFIKKARSEGSNNSKVIKQYRELTASIMPSECKVVQLRNLLIDEIKSKLAS